MPRLTALVVDDHPEIRTRIAKLLVEGGFDVIGQAADGATALESAANLLPDVITLDNSMPGLSGSEVLPRLREELPGAVIVMVTTDRQYEKQARRLGADAYILKTQVRRELVPAIRTACSSRDLISRIADTADQAADLLARVQQARTRYSSSRRKAFEAMKLACDLVADERLTSDGTLAGAQADRLRIGASEAREEYIEALTELSEFVRKAILPKDS